MINLPLIGLFFSILLLSCNQQDSTQKEKNVIPFDKVAKEDFEIKDIEYIPLEKPNTACLETSVKFSIKTIGTIFWIKIKTEAFTFLIKTETFYPLSTNKEKVPENISKLQIWTSTMKTMSILPIMPRWILSNTYRQIRIIMKQSMSESTLWNFVILMNTPSY